MKKYLLLIILSLSYTQELDLSLDWTMADDVFYSQQLDSIIENQISNLSSIKGIIVIHNGKMKNMFFIFGRLAIISLIIIALARPRLSDTIRETKMEIIAIVTSNSIKVNAFMGH